MTASPADYKKLTTETYNRIAAEVSQGFNSFFDTYGRLEANLLTRRRSTVQLRDHLFLNHHLVKSKE